MGKPFAMIAACLLLTGCSETKPNLATFPWETSDLVCVDKLSGYRIGRDRHTGQFTYWERGDWSSEWGTVTPLYAKTLCPGLIP